MMSQSGQTVAPIDFCGAPGAAVLVEDEGHTIGSDGAIRFLEGSRAKYYDIRLDPADGATLATHLEAGDALAISIKVDRVRVGCTLFVLERGEAGHSVYLPLTTTGEKTIHFFPKHRDVSLEVRLRSSGDSEIAFSGIAVQAFKVSDQIEEILSLVADRTCGSFVPRYTADALVDVAGEALAPAHIVRLLQFYRSREDGESCDALTRRLMDRFLSSSPEARRGAEWRDATPYLVVPILNQYRSLLASERLSYFRLHLVASGFGDILNLANYSACVCEMLGLSYNGVFEISPQKRKYYDEIFERLGVGTGQFKDGKSFTFELRDFVEDLPAFCEALHRQAAVADEVCIRIHSPNAFHHLATVPEITNRYSINAFNSSICDAFAKLPDRGF